MDHTIRTVQRQFTRATSNLDRFDALNLFGIVKAGDSIVVHDSCWIGLWTIIHNSAVNFLTSSESYVSWRAHGLTQYNGVHLIAVGIRWLFNLFILFWLTFDDEISTTW